MKQKWVIGLLVVALLIGAFVPLLGVQAAAKTNNFKITIANEIKANDLGYPFNYQFVFSVYREGPLYRQYLLRRGQRIETVLPAGWYSFRLSDREGKVLDSTRYYHILPGASVRWQSNLGPPDLKPQIKLRLK